MDSARSHAPATTALNPARLPAAVGRFDLITLDLDGTLLPHTTAFEVVLKALGRGDDVAASDARYFSGQQTLEETFWEQWAWVQPLSLQEIHRALRAGPWLPGIADGVRRLRDAGLDVTLLTDQPSTLADFLGRWAITRPVCSPVTVKEGAQIGIDARFDKWANLAQRLAADGIPAQRVCHVGNGSNDVPVWKNVGAGIAVFASPEVASAATRIVTQPLNFAEITDAVLDLHALA